MEMMAEATATATSSTKTKTNIYLLSAISNHMLE
jgi:hypothetical protein